jgi:hypothetical protein
VGGLSKTALWTHRGVDPHGHFAWEVSQKRLFRESENGRLCDTVAQNDTAGRPVGMQFPMRASCAQTQPGGGGRLS